MDRQSDERNPLPYGKEIFNGWGECSVTRLFRRWHFVQQAGEA